MIFDSTLTIMIPFVYYSQVVENFGSSYEYFSLLEEFPFQNIGHNQADIWTF